MGKENEKRQGKGIIPLIFVILFFVLIIIMSIRICFRSEGNFYEASKVDKDMKGVVRLAYAARTAYANSKDHDASEVYVIEFTENGYEIYGKNNGSNAAGIIQLKNEFHNYADDGKYESLSLAAIRKKALSVRYSKLNHMVITIDETSKLMTLRCSFAGDKFEDFYDEVELFQNEEKNER